MQPERYVEVRNCLGWPEAGSCERRAQTKHRHRSGDWSPLYCEECDELRELHGDSLGDGREGDDE